MLISNQEIQKEIQKEEIFKRFSRLFNDFMNSKKYEFSFNIRANNSLYYNLSATIVYIREFKTYSHNLGKTVKRKHDISFKFEFNEGNIYNIPFLETTLYFGWNYDHSKEIKYGDFKKYNLKDKKIRGDY